MITVDQMLEEASKLYPVPMSGTQVQAFLRSANSKATNKYTGLSLAESWQKRKLLHIAYWRDRYGLDDLMPKRLIKGERVAEITWVTLYKKQTNQAKVKLLVRKMHSLPLRISNICDKQDAQKQLISMVERQVEAISKVPVSIIELKPKGKMPVYSQDKAEIDWLLFKEHALQLLANADASCQLKAGRLARLIASCRFSKTARYKTPDQLLHYIKEQIKCRKSQKSQ